MGSFRDRLEHAWNAFMGRGVYTTKPEYGIGYGNRPDRVRYRAGTERTMIASIYTRLALDVVSIDIQHVRLDENGRYSETIHSGLQECLSTEANKDQTGRAFMQDVVMSLFDEGVVAIVPVDTSFDPRNGSSPDIRSLRTAKIVEWFPDNVRLRLYNDRIGQIDEIILPKSTVAIIENPLYSVMNEPNSTLRRLSHKLAVMDSLDDAASSGKLDIIVQFPFSTRSDLQKQRAEARLRDIETQLKDSTYGIAYIDATEKVTQLNRSLENNILKEIEFLTVQLYDQLGLTEEVFKGTADEKTMLNYYNRTIEPIISAIVDEMKRKFLTKTARTQGQSIMFFRNPFKLVPVAELAEIADKLTRNEILSSNEVRAIMGYKPSDDPSADELRNKNLNAEERPTEEDGDIDESEQLS